MAIWGKSKRKQTTTQPKRQSPPPPSQTSFQYAVSSPSDSDNVQQQFNTHQEIASASQQQSWLITPIPVQYQPVFVEQNLSPPIPERIHQRAKSAGAKLTTLNLGSVSSLLLTKASAECPMASIVQSGISPLYQQGTQCLNQSAALCARISSKFDNVITLIDGEKFSGAEKDLVVSAPHHPELWQEQEVTERGMEKGKSKGMVNNPVSSALTATNYFAKVHLYANSRLPPNLPPLKLYISTFPLLCLAVQYSERVYNKPTGQEKETHVDADCRLGTKAMVIKSVPMDDMNTIVFAIRGTQTFMDWAVNLNSAPASPEGFLDDPGNFCHSGFLAVARNMVKPVAARLRHLLQEDPRRSKCSLLITGHSAGGAIAALLYSHMLATSPETESELTTLTACFKRVHCVSFGAPPISLLPLTKPTIPALRKSIFMSFVNEGDPVARADKAYVRSLLDLYSSPAPEQPSLSLVVPSKQLNVKQSLFNLKNSTSHLALNLKNSTSNLAINKIKQPSSSKLPPAPGFGPIWPVPEAALSNAGRIVLLRSVDRYETRQTRKKSVPERMDEGVVAQIVTDELLRGVVWGDPVCHMMTLYARRVEVLATNAVMGRS